MLDIKFLKNSSFFEHISVKKWNVIFNIWDFDKYLYILLSWEVSIEKYTTSKQNEMKVLSTLKWWELFGESSITSFLPKKIKVSTLKDSQILRINAKIWITSLIETNPIKWLELLKYIIAITNKRLLLANEQIVASYEMNKIILEMNKINNESIFLLIEKFKYIIWCDYILYFKSNPYINNYTTLTYDTRNKWLLYSSPIKLDDTYLDLNNIQLSLSKYNIINKLNIWKRLLWYIIYWKYNQDFTENDKKNIDSTITGLSWIINQKNFLDEERDKSFLKMN